MVNYIILGAGGFGQELGEYLHDCLREGVLNGEFAGYLDDTIPAGSLVKTGGRVLGTFATKMAIKEYKFLIGLGDPETRSRVFEEYKAKGATFETLIHPSAYKSSSGIISEGGILCPFSFLGSCSFMEQNCLVNIYSSVGHDCHIGSHCVMSPYATINGHVTLKSQVFLGTKAIVTKGYKLGTNSKISAASVVYNDVPDNAIAFGNPARMKNLA